ncbi:MAG: hypothetical protein Q8859_09000, partial [Bacteroidota bacterium]|nr:hypothetical protein [Bacteroidota bacterium]
MLIEYIKQYGFKLEKVDTDHKRRTKMLLWFSVAGFIFGLIWVLVNLIFLANLNCMPGYASFAALSALMFYFTIVGREKIAVGMVYLFPIPVYFFFMSEEFAVVPLNLGIDSVLHSIMFAFLCFLLFTKSKKQLLIFWVIGLLTLLLNVTLNHYWSSWFLLRWPVIDNSINPIALFFAYSFVIIFVLWRYTSTLADISLNLRKQYRWTDNFFKNAKEPLALLEYQYDEQNVIGMKVLRVNHLFDEAFNIPVKRVV